MEQNKASLTSAEIGALWTAYMNDSMVFVMQKHMLEHVEDEDIRAIVKQSADLSERHLELLVRFFEEVEFAKPRGFAEEDVNMEAPQLFTDTFCLAYIDQRATVGMLAYAGFVSISAREDVRSYFIKGLQDAMTLSDQVKKMALNKGIYSMAPQMKPPTSSEFITDKDYYSGLNPLKDKRPLNAIEVANLHKNVVTNSVGYKLSMAFAQTAQSKEVRGLMTRSKEVSQKHMRLLGNILLEDDIVASQLPDIDISDSITWTYSDRLIMFQMSLLLAAGMGNYAASASASMRTDLVLNYERLSAEAARLAKSGADLTISKGWFEQPPGTVDRKRLIREKNKKD